MKVVFAGTPEFAAVALRAIHEAGFTVPLVLTQPDRPAGRGMQLQASSVKQYALAHGMPVAQPLSLRTDSKDPERAEQARAAHAQLLALDYDVMVVAAYGLILPRSTLDIAPCINIHGSLLPRWRGAAPIHRAIESGDAEKKKEAIKLMDKVPSLRQRIAGKSIPMEVCRFVLVIRYSFFLLRLVNPYLLFLLPLLCLHPYAHTLPLPQKFVARKARKFTAQSHRLALPALELAYIFLGIAHAPRGVITGKMYQWSRGSRRS